MKVEISQILTIKKLSNIFFRKNIQQKHSSKYSLAFTRSFVNQCIYVQVYSLFDEDLRVLGLSVLDKDPRFFFKLKPKSELVIKSKSITSLGQLRFSQSLSCTSNCYAGFPLHTAGESLNILIKYYVCKFRWTMV